MWLTVPELQPAFGLGDNWSNYCKSIFNETFARDPADFPCLSTCAFCEGGYFEPPSYGMVFLK